MIELRNLSYTDTDLNQVLLHNINLTIQKGEKIAIVGPSGSGKSLLGIHLCGLHQKALSGKTEGKIILDGEDITHKENKGLAGIVWQNPTRQLFCDTVTEEISLGPQNMGHDEFQIKTIVDFYCEMAQLNPVQKIRHLSLGQQQKLSIISMLAINPDILFLDEPTNFLDPHSANELFNFLENLKTTIIIVEHNYKNIESFAEKYIELKSGKLVSQNHVPPHLPHLTKVTSVNSQTPIIKVKDLVFGYDTKSSIFNKLSLELYYNEIIAITGKNGSGKSTFLKLISKLLLPQAGVISTNEQAVLVCQNPDDQFFSYTVFEECLWYFKKKKIHLDLAKEKIKAILTDLDLIHLKDQLPMTLSYGEKRRLSIAIVLLTDANIICMDEPTVGLDQENLLKLQQIMMKIASTNKIVIYCSHDLEFCHNTNTRLFSIAAENLHESH